jgi:GH15 family glucan-1,4-alpha-glucosidase
MAEAPPYPAIADYGLIGDCHSAALVSRTGSIDWCCLPRFDSPSCFGRLLDWQSGGFFALAPEEPERPGEREYVDDTLVLRTTFRTSTGEASVTDCFLGPPATVRGDERRRILRVVDGQRGTVRFALRVAPRLDYADAAAFIRCDGDGIWSASAGADGLLVWSEAQLGRAEEEDSEALTALFEVAAGDRVRTLLTYLHPEQIAAEDLERPQPRRLDEALEQTLGWWREWTSHLEVDGAEDPELVRSALVLKALSYVPTGAMVAAPTTSLPESLDDGRTWDYRFSWVRDSSFASRSLARLGCEREADEFRRFIERSAAGRPRDVRILYGIGGERRTPTLELRGLAGWRGFGPVRVGNDAADQRQLDSCAHLVVQSWHWNLRGKPPSDDYWRFLVELIESAIERWREPDAGIWEWRGEPRHFVHSKVLSWAAVDRGLRLALDCGHRVPADRWRQARDEIRGAIEDEGYDHDRSVYRQAFGTSALDAALLRIPTLELVDWRDDRMVRTVDAIREELSVDGLLRRYTTDDGLPGEEGAFLACSFWLSEALAHQGRSNDAREVFDRATSTANDLGLFSEEWDTGTGEMLGNFPQALTHLSHIEAALALGGKPGSDAEAGAAALHDR